MTNFNTASSHRYIDLGKREPFIYFKTYNSKTMEKLQNSNVKLRTRCNKLRKILVTFMHTRKINRKSGEECSTCILRG